MEGDLEQKIKNNPEDLKEGSDYSFNEMMENFEQEEGLYEDFFYEELSEEEDLSEKSDYLSRIANRYYIQELKERKWSVKKPIPEEPIVLYHNSGTKEYPLAAQGNILVVAGPPKTRKSTLVNSIILSAYSEDINRNLGFRLDIKETDCILAIDTEMSEYYFDLNNRKLNKLGGGHEENDLELFESYNLRPYDENQRCEQIDFLINKKKDCLGVVIIDGIADLVGDINDRRQTSTVISHLLKWSNDTNALIICVIHTTWNTTKLTGTIGTELQKKMDGCLMLTYDEETDLTLVKHYLSRGPKIADFEFTHDAKGYPSLVSGDKW